MARQYRDTTRGVSGVSDGWSRVVDALAKLAGTEHILSVMSSAALKKMSAAEVCEILYHVNDDTVVLDLNDEASGGGGRESRINLSFIGRLFNGD